MAKQKDSAIQKINPGPGIAKIEQMPQFMQEAGQEGLDVLRKYIIPPRLKLVQPQSNADLLKVFGPGDVIMMPNQSLLFPMPTNDSGRGQAEEGTPFRFVPLFFYPEWCQWTPMSARGVLPAILYRTTDPRDPFTIKCRNANLRKEKHKDKPDIVLTNCEHLNFIVVLLDHELGATPMIMSFSRGEHTTGSKFANLVQMRKAPIYGMIFQAVVRHRENDKGHWYGMDIENPASEQWITDSEVFGKFAEAHRELKEAHAQGLVHAQYDDPESDADPAATTAVPM